MHTPTVKWQWGYLFSKFFMFFYRRNSHFQRVVVFIIGKEWKRFLYRKPKINETFPSWKAGFFAFRRKWKKCNIFCKKI